MGPDAEATRSEGDAVVTELFGDDLPRPDGRRLFLVVDSCHSGGVNLPHGLLDHLGVKKIDLLVLSHPDLDHVRGFARLARERAPTEIWRYPLGSGVRDFAAELLRRRPGDERLFDLRDALDAIDEHREEHGESTDASFDRSWVGSGYDVRCIAPTPWDVERANKLLKHCTEYIVGERRRISRRFERFLSGDVSLGDAPNVLSVALAVRWGDVRIVLGGDVERGCAKPFSGWKGVLRLLDKPGRSRGALVQSVAAVKVAHHGSVGAFHAPAWERHAKADGSTIAMMTPFQSKLPAPPVLRWLKEHTGRLAISHVAPEAERRARDGGWAGTHSGKLAATAAPCIVGIFSADGAVSLLHGGQGSLFQSSGIRDKRDLRATP